jgi:hypothetical protein
MTISHVADKGDDYDYENPDLIYSSDDEGIRMLMRTMGSGC